MKKSAFDFGEKWHVRKEIKELRDMLKRHGNFAMMDRFSTMTAYISVLEIDLRNRMEELNGLRVQSK